MIGTPEIEFVMPLSSSFRFSFLFFPCCIFNAPPPSDTVRKQKLSLEDLFSPALSQFKKYLCSGNLKFNNLGIFQGLKMRILVEKNPSNFSLAKFHSKYFGLLWVNV